MKKVGFLVLVAALLLAILAGCTSDTDEGSRIYKIELEGNATTGYAWTYTMDKEGIVEEIMAEYIVDESEDDMVGVGGTFVFEFHGMKEGTVTLTFEYTRLWEDEEPEQVVTYKLRVDDEGLITQK